MDFKAAYNQFSKIIFIGLFTVEIAILLNYAFSRIPYFEPFADSIIDIDITDTYFENLNNGGLIDRDIVIANIGRGDRKVMSDLLNELNSYNYNTLLVDLILPAYSRSPYDSLLRVGFEQANNPVFLIGNDSTLHTNRTFSQYGTVGFGQFDRGLEGKIRNFNMQTPTLGNTINHIGYEVARNFNPEAAQVLKQRNNETEIINYSRSLTNFVVLERSASGELKALSFRNGFFREHHESLEKVLVDKIIIMGFVGNRVVDYVSAMGQIEDKFDTPMTSIFGDDIPESYAAIIHANIIRQIIDGSYIDYWYYLSLVISVLLIIALIGIMIPLHRIFKSHAPIVSRLITLFLVFVLIVGTVYFFKTYQVKMDFRFLILCLIILPETIEYIMNVIFRYYFYWDSYIKKLFNAGPVIFVIPLVIDVALKAVGYQSILLTSLAFALASAYITLIIGYTYVHAVRHKKRAM